MSSCLRLSPELKSEIAALGKQSIPVAATYFLGYANQLISQGAVGHTSSTHLAAAALGNMYANAFGFSILYGLSSAVDTLASQAVGARNYRRVPEVAQRGLAIMTLLSIPIACALYFSGAVLGHLGQDPETARDAGLFTRGLILGLPAVVTADILRKQLLSIGDMRPPLFSASAGILMNALLSYVLVYHTSLGFLGAPLATSASQWSMMVTLMLYFRNHRNVNRVGRAFLRCFSCCACCLGRDAVRSVRHVELVDVAVSSDDTKKKGAPENGAVESSLSEQYGSGGDGGGALARRSSSGAISDDGFENDHEESPLAKPTTAAASNSSSDNAKGSMQGVVTAAGSGAGSSAPAADVTSNGTSRTTTSRAPAPAAANEAAANETLAAGEVRRLTTTAAPSLTVDDLIDATTSRGDDPTQPALSLRSAFSGWPEFLALGVPGVAMLFIEWASYEFASLIAGWHSTTTLAAHTIIATTASLSFMFVLGLSVPVGIRVGQRLGERRPDRARLAYRAVLFCWVILVLGNACVVMAARTVWSRTFTADPAVIELVEKWLPLVAVYTLFDAGQGVCSGVLRGIGRPALAAVTNVIAYCGIALPVSYALCIRHDMGLSGIWIGFTIGVASSFFFLVCVLGCINWEMESEKAYTRATKASPSVEIRE